MLRYKTVISLLVIGFSLFGVYLLQKPVPTQGEITIQSHIEGLNIRIDEKLHGQTRAHVPASFALESEVGTGGFGFHRVVLHKEMNATHEFYLEKEFKYQPFEPIVTTENTLKPRLKKAFLAQDNGLLHTVHLTHQYTSHLAIDERYLYILSQSRTKVYSKAKREEKDGEYLEVYDKQTRKLIAHIVLNEEENDSYDRDIALSEHFVYIASKNGKVLFFDKNELLSNPRKQYLPSSPIEDLNKIRFFGEYLFRFGKNGMVELYKNHLHVNTIDTKKHRPDKYASLEDKRFDKVFDVVYADKKLFISNDLGVVQLYFLSDENVENVVYLTQLELTSLAHDITDMAFYNKRYLLIGGDEGLSLYDTQNLQMLFQNKNVMPKNSKTGLYQVGVFNDYVLFARNLSSPQLGVYDIKSDTIVHDFQGESEHINDFVVEEKVLYSLDDGHVHLWDLEKIR